MASITATVTRVGDTSTSEGIARSHHVLIDRPEAKGGLDRGPMGGELLLLALGGCFMSNLIAAAKARDVVTERLAVTVRGELDDAPARFSAIDVEVDAGASDPAMVDKLMTIAARGCIVHNTLAPGVKLSLRRA